MLRTLLVFEPILLITSEGHTALNFCITIRLVPPKIVFGPRSRTVDLSVQSQVTLSCKADGEPTPTISWKKEGNNTILPSTDGKLIFTNLKPRDKGKYMCIAHNSEGNATATADLMLHCKYLYCDIVMR